jgi:hypothetical protein
MSEPLLAEPSIQEVGNNAANASHPAMTNIGSIMQGAEKLVSGKSVSDDLRNSLLGAKTAEDQPDQGKQQQQQENPEEVEKKQEAPQRKQKAPVDDTQSGLERPSDIKQGGERSSDQPRDPGSALESFRQDAMEEQDRIRRGGKKSDAPTDSTKSSQAQKTDEAKVQDAVSDKPVTMEEIEQSLASTDKGTTSKRHQERMRFLAAKAKLADELQAKLLASEGKSTNVQETAEFKALREQHEAATKELLHFRRRNDLNSDPEFKKKYDEVIEQADTSIINKLKEAGLSDKSTELIKKMGGFEAFSRSNATLYVPQQDSAGQITQKEISASQLAQDWLKSMPMGDAEYIRAKLIEKYNLQDAKKAAYEAEQGKATEYVTKYRQWSDDWQKKSTWLKDKEVQATATDAEKAEAIDYNRYNQEARDMIKLSVEVKSVEDYAKLVEAAASAPNYRRENIKLTKERDALKQQIEQLSSAVRSVPKGGGGSIAKGSNAPVKKTVKEEMQTSAADSIRADLEALRAGDRSGYSSENE